MNLSLNPLADVAAPLINLGTTLIDRIFPDKVAQAAEREKASLELLKATQDGTFRQTQLDLSVMLAEAQSADPWTSRARPSFLYVMYVMILCGIPMGVLYAFNPAMALNVAAGLKAWLEAIPDSLYTLFGVCFTGYTVARSVEKARGVAK